MDLIEVNKDNRKAQRTALGADYVPLHPLTRSWEVPRHHVTIEKIIGKGAFGQVAKGTAVGLRGSPETTTVAIKMLKGELLYRKLNDSQGLQPFRKCYWVTVFFLAICHSITYVIILAFRIIFPLIKFYSLFLTLQQMQLNRTREIWWKNLKQWSSYNHILTSLNFLDVLQNLVCFGYAGLFFCKEFSFDLSFNAFSSLIICFNEESLLHNQAQQKTIT